MTSSNKAKQPDDFYVGYKPKAAADLAPFLKKTVLGLGLLVLVVGAALAALQNPFSTATFEFGQYQELEGVLIEHPYPMLRVGDDTHYLVAFGKRSAAREASGLNGRTVRVRAARIYHDDQRMLELEDGSLHPQDDSAKALLPSPEPLGRHKFIGEIVDSKCYLGVMKPGRGKPHRSCAVRCISGGIPPVLRVEASTGEVRHLVLIDQNGGPIGRELLQFVAEPIEVEGDLTRRGDLLFLAASPDSFQRRPSAHGR